MRTRLAILAALALLAACTASHPPSPAAAQFARDEQQILDPAFQGWATDLPHPATLEIASRGLFGAEQGFALALLEQNWPPKVLPMVRTLVDESDQLALVLTTGPKADPTIVAYTTTVNRMIAAQKNSEDATADLLG